MAIIVPDPDVLIDYIPAYGGNRESEDPCVVRMRFVPYKRIQHYASIMRQEASRGTGASMTEIQDAIQKRQFVESVDSISGYYVGERETQTAAEFYDSAPAELVVEIIKAMESSARLSEGQRKN